jgi:hypothetical protein
VAVVGVDPVDQIAEGLIGHKDAIIVGHNIAYDLLVIGRMYPKLMPLIFDAYNENRVACTIVREKLLLIANGRYWRLKANGFTLSALSARYGVNKEGEDPWRLRYSELEGIPYNDWPEAAQSYATNDVRSTRTVYNGQVKKGMDIDYFYPDEYHQSRAAFALHLIGAAGVRTDPKAIAEFEASERAEFEKDKRILIAKGLVWGAKNSRSFNKARELMASVMEAKGVTPKKTKTGQISLDEESCEKSGNSLLMAFQRYGSRNSLLTRIQSLKLGVEQPINPFFDSLIETGRTSCRKGRPGAPTNGYQIQNMRRIPGERECFIPAPGNVFIACDYDTMELRTLAQCCLWAVGNSKLGEAIKAGLDPHLALAAELLGMEYQEALTIYNTPNLSEPRRDEVKLARQGCKIANFGYPGGMGASAFRDYARGYGMELTTEQAETLKENWLLTWSEMEGYFGWINTFHWRQEARGEHIKSLTDVEHFLSKRRRASVTYTVACNGFFQGLAADAAKAAAYQLTQAVEIGEIGPAWKIWNFIHDEFILEGPEHDCDRVAKLVAKTMVDAAQPWVPDIPISATPCAMRRWSKKAEPVYGASGELIPWEGK